MTPWCTMVGVGPGAREWLTAAGERAIAEAEVLAGAPGLLTAWATEGATLLPWRGPLEGFAAELEAHAGRRVAVLVSGDPGVSSLAGSLRRLLPEGSCRWLPGISSVQLACARLLLSWEAATIVRLHGGLEEPPVAATLERGPWLCLMGAAGGEALVASWMRGLGARCYCCEDLSLATERIWSPSASEIEELAPVGRRILVLVSERDYVQRS